MSVVCEKRKFVMRNWYLDGERVNGLYMGAFPFSGLVESSRVKYGGEVQHTVVLDEPIHVYGRVRERVLVTTKDINRILDADEV
jgi:hypothetical protein